jgi:acyl-ACP thioesterase
MIGCETFWAVFNTKIRRPEALALPFEHFELYPEQKATQISFSKINLNNEKESVFEKTVVLSDLDNVNHVNNVKYLEWCLDLVDENLILNQKIESFEMNFLKELSLKDKVVIIPSVRLLGSGHENLTSNAMIFSITKEDKTCFALQLNLK